MIEIQYFKIEFEILAFCVCIMLQSLGSWGASLAYCVITHSVSVAVYCCGQSQGHLESVSVSWTGPSSVTGHKETHTQCSLSSPGPTVHIFGLWQETKHLKEWSKYRKLPFGQTHWAVLCQTNHEWIFCLGLLCKAQFDNKAMWRSQSCSWQSTGGSVTQIKLSEFCQASPLFIVTVST